MSPGREIRRARPAESTSVGDLYLRARRAAAGVPPAVHSEAAVRAWLTNLITATDTVWVAVVDDAPVAVLVVGDGWVEQLYVDSAHRRRGHGAALLDHAKAGRDALSLWTFAANASARAFYEARGFTTDGRADSDNEERTPALRYRWRRATG